MERKISPHTHHSFSDFLLAFLTFCPFFQEFFLQGPHCTRLREEKGTEVTAHVTEANVVAVATLLHALCLCLCLFSSSIFSMSTRSVCPALFSQHGQGQRVCRCFFSNQTSSREKREGEDRSSTSPTDYGRALTLSFSVCLSVSVSLSLCLCLCLCLTLSYRYVSVELMTMAFGVVNKYAAQHSGFGRQ